MSTRRKKFVVAAVVVLGIYALTPFVAGLLKTYDRRGPKIFVEAHHEIFYRLGYCMAGGGKPRVPPTERSWFYGIQGEPMQFREIRDDLEALSHEK